MNTMTNLLDVLSAAAAELGYCPEADATERAAEDVNASAAAIRAITKEMRDRKVNHGKSSSPTLIAWADRIDAELTRLGL